MKKLSLSLLLCVGLSACYQAPQTVPSNTLYQREVEIERCDWDDHPNEPECRGTRKHQRWLAEQKQKEQAKNKAWYSSSSKKSSTYKSTGSTCSYSFSRSTSRSSRR